MVKKPFFQVSVNVNPRYLYFKALYQYGELLPVVLYRSFKEEGGGSE